MNNTIYLDNAATTPLLPAVREAMVQSFDNFGNPSALYDIGAENKEKIYRVKSQLSNVINCCNPDNIVITSGASESNSYALLSTYNKFKGVGNHIITSKIEHHSILLACEFLEKYHGAEITYLDVDSQGCINPDDVFKAIRGNTILVSIMTANNETGSIQPIEKIYDKIKDVNPDIIFHTDATQAFCHINTQIIPFDLCSFSAHKFGGPKGIGGLYIKYNLDIPPYIFGTQQLARRGGTENVPAIIGMGVAAEISNKNLNNWYDYTLNLSTYFLNRVLSEIPGTRKNSPNIRLPGIVNIRFDRVRGEELMMLLNMHKIYVSTGSACNSLSNEPSYVLKAIGLTDEEANSSIRFSFSHNNTKEEIDYVVDILKELVPSLRR